MEKHGREVNWPEAIESEASLKSPNFNLGLPLNWLFRFDPAQRTKNQAVYCWFMREPPKLVISIRFQGPTQDRFSPLILTIVLFLLWYLKEGDEYVIFSPFWIRMYLHDHTFK